MSRVLFFDLLLFSEKGTSYSVTALHFSFSTDPAVKITDCVRLHSGVATGHERRLGQEKATEHCAGDNAAPLMHFGSTFRHNSVFPNMIS